MRPAAARRLAGALALALAATAAPLPAGAVPYRLTPADRAEIERLLRAFFEAARDGNTAAANATIPSRQDFTRIFAGDAGPLIDAHRRAIDRDVRDLRERFAGGAWVGVSGSFTQAATIDVGQCGRFAVATSECTAGPVIDWRVGDEVRHLRIDKLIRVGGRWRIFDPRL